MPSLSIKVTIVLKEENMLSIVTTIRHVILTIILRMTGEKFTKIEDEFAKYIMMTIEVVTGDPPTMVVDFINMIKDQSLWENFITGEMRPSRQLLRWYQLEDLKNVKQTRRQDLNKEDDTDDGPSMSTELAKLLCNPSEIELDKQHGKEYTRDMVALDSTSVVHVADFGDAVTYYEFWTTSK